MRKPTHTKKFSADAGLLWYAAALTGLLLYCFVPLSSSHIRTDEVGYEENIAPAAAASAGGIDSGTDETADGAEAGADADFEANADAVPVFLMQGDCGDEVYRLQTRLRSLGYDVGACTGVYTGQTASAVRRFQLDCGFVGDGICSAEVSRALAYLDGVSAMDSDIPTETVCQALEAAGCWNPVPGDEAEPGTQEVRLRNALILFQRTHGLCGSGTADYATLCALGLLRGDRLAAMAGTGAEAAEAARFDLRCRLLTESLAEYVLCYPAAYDLYTLTVCASMLCNRVEDERFPGSFDAVCAAGVERCGRDEAELPRRDAVEQRARDILLLRAAEDALRAYLYAEDTRTDPARGAVYVCPASCTLPQDADICIRVRDFVFFR